MISIHRQNTSMPALRRLAQAIRLRRRSLLKLKRLADWAPSERVIVIAHRVSDLDRYVERAIRQRAAAYESSEAAEFGFDPITLGM